MKGAILIIGFLLLAVDTASACNRCGNYSRCSYVAPQQVIVQKEVVQVDSPDVFVVQNSYPQPLVAQGATSYATVSYQNAVLPLFDPNRYFEQELQLIRAANDTNALRSERTSSLVQRVVELQAPAVERLASGQAAQMVLRAAGLDPHHNTVGTQSAVVISRDATGQLQVRQLTETQAQQANTTVTSRLLGEGSSGETRYTENPALRYTQQFCGKCHGTGLAQPKGGFYLGDGATVREVMKREWFSITNRVANGSMPPADSPQPTTEERQAILNELQSIIGGK